MGQIINTNRKGGLFSKIFMLPNFSAIPSSKQPLSGSSYMPLILQPDEAALICINRVDSQITRQALYYFPLIKVALEAQASVPFGQVATHDPEIDMVQEVRDFNASIFGEITPPILYKLPMPNIAPTEPIEFLHPADIETFFVTDFSRIQQQISKLNETLHSRVKSSINLSLIASMDATNEEIEKILSEVDIDIKTSMSIEYYPYFVFSLADSKTCVVNAISGASVSGTPHNDGSSFIKETYEAQRHEFEEHFFNTHHEQENIESEPELDLGVDESILKGDKDATVIIIEQNMAKEALDEIDAPQQSSTKALKQSQTSSYEPEDEMFSPLEKQKKSLKLLRKNALASVPFMVVTLLASIFLINVPFSISIPFLLLCCGAVFALDHFKFDGEIRIPIFVLVCATLAVYVLLSIFNSSSIIEFAMKKYNVDPSLYEEMFVTAKTDFDILIALFLLQTLLLLILLIRRNHKTMLYEHSIFNRQIYSVLFLSTLSSLMALMIANNTGLLFVNPSPLRIIYMVLTLAISLLITAVLSYIWHHLPSQKLRLPSVRK